MNPIRTEVLEQTVRERGAGETQVCDQVFASLLRAIDAKDPGYRM